MKILAASLAVLGVMIPWNSAFTQATTRISVGAVVPPPLCNYPESCQTAVKDYPSRAVIGREAVRYSGARPRVLRRGDLLVVLF
ncbi:MAG: hypothetical protein QNI96_08295 [Woeseiaceae bacterium]|nr:hypothetical protein [Woeseiaceae bacterium]